MDDKKNDVDLTSTVDTRGVARNNLAALIEPVLIANHVQHNTVLARELAEAIMKGPPAAPKPAEPTVTVASATGPADPTMQLAPVQTSVATHIEPVPQNSVVTTTSVVEGVDKSSKP